MSHPVLLILALTWSVSRAVIFKGNCPKLTINDTVSSEILHSYVIYYTEVFSRINHIYYNSASNLNNMRLYIYPENDTHFKVHKMNTIMQECFAFEYLSRSEENGGYLKHSVHNRIPMEDYKNENGSCGLYWDGYYLIQKSRILIIWGCVNMPESEQHEEGVWVLVIVDGLVRGLNKIAVQEEARSLFPIGSITKDHLKENSIMPKARNIPVNVDCQRLNCKHATAAEKDSKLLWLNINIILGILVFLCVISVVYIQLKY